MPVCAGAPGGAATIAPRASNAAPNVWYGLKRNFICYSPALLCRHPLLVGLTGTTLRYFEGRFPSFFASSLNLFDAFHNGLPGNFPENVPPGTELRAPGYWISPTWLSTCRDTERIRGLRSLLATDCRT